jgi:hypothetical protein
MLDYTVERARVVSQHYGSPMLLAVNPVRDTACNWGNSAGCSFQWTWRFPAVKIGFGHGGGVAGSERHFMPYFNSVGGCQWKEVTNKYLVSASDDTKYKRVVPFAPKHGDFGALSRWRVRFPLESQGNASQTDKDDTIGMMSPESIAQ